MSKNRNIYNSEQRKAITFGKGPLLIVAGAGTGKTMVITERIAHLILDKNVKTDAILALTFTEKAAQEMEERVDRLLPYGYVDLWISTFHSFCRKILEQHALDIGLSNSFKLLDETGQWLLMRRNLEKFNLDYYRPLGNPTKFIQALLKHFSRAKDEEIYPEQYLAYAEKLRQNADSTMSNELLNQEALRIKEIAETYHIYQQLLLDNNALDFGDLINYTLKLFRTRPNILKKYQEQFEYILLDEFQDTNYAQYDLVKLLAGEKKNLTVVGDDDQSIYKFRGASVSNILQFKKDFPECQEIVLTINYRSNQNILDLAYNFIQLNNPNRLEYQLNKQGRRNKPNKLNKMLKANKKGKGIIEHIHKKNLDLEVEAIIKKIIELKKKDKEAIWNDFAILVRANDSANSFVNYLRQTNIPYQFLSLRGLYSKPIILDILAYFKLLDNYHESTALFRILSSPILDIAREDIVKICHEANKKSKSIYEILKEINLIKNLEDKTISEVNFLLGLISKHNQLVKEKSVSEILKAFLEDSKYLEKLLVKDEAESTQAISYVSQFYKRIKEFEESSLDSKLNLFMEEIDLEMEAGETGKLDIDLEAGPEMIRIMTIHAAKGLEFKYVFIPNLVERRFPTDERKDLIELPEELVKEIIPEGDIHLQEERRLFYVAMTRAKKGLFFSSADDYGGSRLKKISRFLEELSQTNPDFKLDKKVKELKELTLENPKIEKEKKVFKYVLPIRFSYSQLAAFAKCPYQYKLQFIYKVPVFGKAQFSYGKSMHKTLENFFKLIVAKKQYEQTNLFGGEIKTNKQKKIGDLISLNQLLDIFESNWIDEWFKDKNQREEYYKKAQKSLKNFYEQIRNQICLTESVEKQFYLKIGEFTIKGVIDRIDRLSNNSIRIIDYKTGEAKAEGKMTPEDKMQLLIYQLAAEDVLKEKVQQLTYYYLDDNSTVSFLGDKKDKEKVKKEIIKEIKKIQNSNFAATPSQFTCKYCDFRNICEFRL